MELEDFRKAVRKALIDRDKSTGWLVEEINAATGKRFDTGYLSKVLNGQRKSLRIVQETGRILGLELPASYQ
jgi:hypothetical protein